MVTEPFINHLRGVIGTGRPLILPILAQEEAGTNKIPLAMAHVIAHRLGLDVEHHIVQKEKVFRTNSDANHRLAFNPTFDGHVYPGKVYLIVDDTLTMGGTIASLRGYIENRGGHVIGAAVMVAHQGSLNMAIKPEMIKAIEAKHGNTMNDFWKETFGYGIDKLTQGEAGHLRKARSVDEIRDRIAAARDAGSRRLDEGRTAKTEEGRGGADQTSSKWPGLSRQERINQNEVVQAGAFIEGALTGKDAAECRLAMVETEEAFEPAFLDDDGPSNDLPLVPTITNARELYGLRDGEMVADAIVRCVLGPPAFL
jgi:hypothetical protein